VNGRYYDICIGYDLLATAGLFCQELGWRGRCLVVTHPCLSHLYWPGLEQNLCRHDFSPQLVLVDEGEESKSLTTAGFLYEALYRTGADRHTPILALGGGVIGDLAGFVAATYQRGVPLAHFPTTLLAQVDSSIGGKTALNYHHLKNQIGLYYQPSLVLSDLGTLSSITARQIQSGMAEVVKYGMIASSDLFAYVESRAQLLLALQPEVLQHVVATCACIKAEIVAADERDKGQRRLLNFGHTVAHAAEAVSNFSLTHGEAVAIGMVVAARLACRLGMFSQEEASRLVVVLEKLGLPTVLPPFPAGEFMAAMQHDKKARNGKLSFVLPRRIGEAVVISEVSPETILQEISR
jgi:3-dehydroquinate synthase